jgi:hypothetical protein
MATCRSSWTLHFTRTGYSYIVYIDRMRVESTLHYILMRVFSDELPVFGVQYVGILHPECKVSLLLQSKQICMTDKSNILTKK